MDLAEVRAKLCTVIAIPVTPFAADGSLDRPALAALLDRMLAAGVTAITMNGNTSEFYSLSSAEQDLALEVALDVVGDRALIVAGAGYDVGSVVRVGKLAQARGVPAIMVHQPVHPYLSGEGWLRYHQEIAEALPGLGLVLYVRSPVVTGEVLAALAERCPTVIGVKYALPDPLRLAAAVELVAPDRLAWVCGLAEMWAPFFWTAGARGFTSGLVNVRPALALKLLRCLQAGDLAGAQSVAALVRPFEAMRARDNSALNVSVIKEALAQLGLCARAVRPPIAELNAPQRAEVTAILDGFGHTA